MGLFVWLLNYCVSFVAFITATALVIFMLIGFVSGTYDVVLLMLDTIFLDPVERQAVFAIVNTEFLHTIAVLIILMKAYRILVEYMRNHHVDIKYVVEIAIIACVLELLFNSGGYSDHMQLVLLGLAIGFLGIYAFRYDVLKRAMLDTRLAIKELEMPEETTTEVVETTPKPARKRAPRKTTPKRTKKTE